MYCWASADPTESPAVPLGHPEQRRLGQPSLWLCIFLPIFVMGNILLSMHVLFLLSRLPTSSFCPLSCISGTNGSKMVVFGGENITHSFSAVRFSQLACRVQHTQTYFRLPLPREKFTQNTLCVFLAFIIVLMCSFNCFSPLLLPFCPTGFWTASSLISPAKKTLPLSDKRVTAPNHFLVSDVSAL